MVRTAATSSATSRPKPDWTWLTSTSRLEDITPEQRRQAAGLVGGVPCAVDLTPRLASDLGRKDRASGGGNGGGGKDVKAQDKGDGSEKGNGNGKTQGRGKGKGKGQAGCRARGCKSNPVCYNHLGIAPLLEHDAKQSWITDRLGDAASALSEQRDPDEPAGLRNLGATCYANAFLQLWFHDVPFRNAVYACATSETQVDVKTRPQNTPLFQLALIFGMLEHSEKKVVDPMGLIDALRLNKGDQQDAAEFSKLFMSLIASEFGKNPDPKLKNLVSDQYEGKMRYVTKCECGYESVTETTFLELELGLKDNTTLQNRLDTFLLPELLDGDNKYNCPSCLSARPATRRQFPSHLPPVIHFSLMRFVFDMASLSRKKSKAGIRYPKEIVLGNRVYELRGVITHMGPSAHHGHFICETYDEPSDKWYIYNDETVSPKPPRPTKRLKISSSASSPPPPGEESSKDAYMLVYRRRDGPVRAEGVPGVVRRKVEEDNGRWREKVDGVVVRREVLEDEWDHLKGGKMDTDFIVPREALAGWFQAKTFDELYAPFDFGPVSCDHGQIDPSKSSELRLISALAHDKLSHYSNLPSLDICPDCIGVEFAKRLKDAERQAAVEGYDELMSDLTGDDEGELWCIPQTWVLHWRAGKLPRGATPASEEYTLFCQHGKPSPDMPATSNITASALAHLRSIFGDFAAFHPSDPVCEECSQSGQADAAMMAQWKVDVKFDRAIKKHLDPKPPAYGLDYSVLPTRWVGEWEEYMKTPRERPQLDMERDGYCEHGMLNWDPETTRCRIVDENGWNLICQKYGDQRKPIKIQFGPEIAQGKKYGIQSVSASVCEPCRSARLSTYESTTIPIIITPASTNGHANGQSNGNDKAANGNGKTARTTARSLRARNKTLKLSATPSTTITAIKVEIMNQTGIFPMLQKLSYHERELDEGEKTVKDVGYLDGEEMVLEEMDGEGEWDDDGVKNEGVEEGFGGTALLARINCPDCTYENDGTATCCDMCGRPFNYD
ncbi:hypothetical protein I350_07595 [Cryptococcus amylolentus CBS 6273]|uniref:ubiquitinyl hydrolase 1 n=1 Tax=Cryptococcus amylolentus CBS 6273 TaxID=1296118 RepID=A0A1E3JAR3_9TREE|nr:hypothetical protein I350_07595 [Cryptococcus amylolentus CBS 6273]